MTDDMDCRRLSGPGLRTFLNIADLWGLTDEERMAIVDLPRSTYLDCSVGAREGRELTLSVDTLMRISAVLGIHKALRTLFRGGPEEVVWLRDPHDAPTFGGKPPVELMAANPLAVRRYLDAMTQRADRLVQRRP
ncbi:MAG: antitoxin Xre-like helix-turn-helix domain-containing protein [Methylocystis sp.]